LPSIFVNLYEQSTEVHFHFFDAPVSYFTAMKNLIAVSLIMLFCILVKNGYSQGQPDSTKLCKVETLDGNEFIGLMVSQDSLEVKLETSSLGKVTIPRTSIKTITWLKPSSLKGGKFWSENPQSGRYFWSPNGYGLKKGEGYYQNIWVLFNQASVGVTDYFSVGAGIVPLFFFGGISTPVWIVPKFSIPVVKDKFNLGAGALVGTVLGESNSSFGLVYGLGTIGDRNTNLTLGLGYGFAGGEWGSKPVITLSGMTRLSPKTYLMTENYYIGNIESPVVLLSFGGRTVIKKSGLDYGLFIPISPDLGRFIAIPWLGITVPLGKKN
jgi:hypothetical protein